MQQLKAAFGLGWSQRMVKHFPPQLQRVSVAHHQLTWERDLLSSVSDRGPMLPAGLGPTPARVLIRREAEAEPTSIAS